jgi:hypothetical protein
VTRDDDQQEVGNAHCCQGVEEQRFLPFAAAGQQPHRPLADCLPPLRAKLQLVRRRRDVEFQISADARLASTQVLQAFAVGLRLRGDRTQRRQRRSDQAAQPLVAAQGARR